MAHHIPVDLSRIHVLSIVALSIFLTVNPWGDVKSSPAAISSTISTGSSVVHPADNLLAATPTPHSLYLPLIHRANPPNSVPTPIPTAEEPVTCPASLVTAAAKPGGTIPPSPQMDESILFVSRQIPPKGSTDYAEAGSLPGVGPYSRFQVAAPGKLLVRKQDGRLQTLVDGTTPTAASLNLIDVSAPDISYDGTKVVFAALPQGSYAQDPAKVIGAWRIYIINVDGTNLQQVTFSDRSDLDLSQFGTVARLFEQYDDTDPIWLPDGRIVFSSTRWPGFGMYGGVRSTNLHVVNADGTDLHRITAEHNGADRPLVDPLTGKIVYARWWRNFRAAATTMTTISTAQGDGYQQFNGLRSFDGVPDEGEEVGGSYNLERNTWHLATINPDGTGLRQWAGLPNIFDNQEDSLAYGGSFAEDGSLYTNFFPKVNLVEAAGFGGIRHLQRGINAATPILGITAQYGYDMVRQNPPSLYVYRGNYAAEPEVLPDGRLLVSWAADTNQDYGLYVMEADDCMLSPLYDNPGTTEIRAKVIRARPLPPIIPDGVTTTASRLPPLAEGPYDIDGSFTFEALNVYFNAPVDTEFIDAIPVGSAATIRFFIDHQRNEQTGSHPSKDWPILLQELPVNPDGSVTATSPANVPLFEQIRTARPAYAVPLTGNLRQTTRPGAAHVAGLNFGRPGEVQRCVGCHAGHSMIPVPENAEDAQWTNLAPGATVTVSSAHANHTAGLIDRRVHMAQITGGVSHKYWFSVQGQDPNRQWVQLTFPVPVSIRTVRLYNIPSRDFDVRIHNTTVRLYRDTEATDEITNRQSGPLSDTGTDVAFADVLARAVRIETTDATGDLFGQSVSGLAEVEIIAKGEAMP